MRIILVLGVAILTTSSACGRAQGATDTGSAFAYSSRQQVQCNTATMGLQDLHVEAHCANVDDLPLAGGCSNPGPGGADAILAVSGPLVWEGKFSVPAAWSCTWTTAGNAVNVPNGSATICCVVKSP